MLNFFDKEKYVLYYENLQLYFRLGLKLKKYIAYYNSISHNGQNHVPNLTQRKKAEKQKNGDKDGKALHKLMNNVVKIMKNFRNRIYVKAKRLTRKKIFQNGHQDQAI